MIIFSDQQLHRFLERFDYDYRDKAMDIFGKSIQAYVAITKSKSIPMTNWEYTGSYDPFFGHSLFQKIHDWYASKYGSLGHLKDLFGTRKLIVRGNILGVKIPQIFNGNPQDIDPIKCIPDLPPTLLALLSQAEIEDIAARVRSFYVMGSRMALCSTVLRSNPGDGDLLQLVLRGRNDLESAVAAFQAGDPNPSLWSATQAVEKYLKALLLSFDPSLTLDMIKKDYGHDLKKLLDDCAKHDAWINIIRSFIEGLDFSTKDRYLAPKHSSKRAMEIIDESHKSCDAVSQILIAKYNTKAS